jgi:hypothetical protein
VLSFIDSPIAHRFPLSTSYLTEDTISMIIRWWVSHYLKKELKIWQTLSLCIFILLISTFTNHTATGYDKVNFDPNHHGLLYDRNFEFVYISSFTGTHKQTPIYNFTTQAIHDWHRSCWYRITGLLYSQLEQMIFDGKWKRNLTPPPRNSLWGVLFFC